MLYSAIFWAEGCGGGAACGQVNNVRRSVMVQVIAEFRLFLVKFSDMKRILALALCCALTAAGHKPLTWVAIGDSITYLNDHLDETGHRLTKGYLTDVVERLPYVH